MLNFRKARLEDKEELDRLFAKSGCPSLEYNFTTLFLWQNEYNMEFAVEDDVLFLRSGRGKKSYLFPCAGEKIDAAVDYLVSEGVNFYSLSKEQTEYLELRYPDRFEFCERRDMEDYVYKAECLAELKGKKLSSKRNHINRFITENPDWSYEDINLENIGEVAAMHDKWCALADIEAGDGLAEETSAVKKALKYFGELKLVGGLIRAGGEVVAFSIGDPLNEKTFLVHIEKAFATVSGSYQIINREFVRRNCAEYEFVDREEDTGDEGLRKAKLSYKPVMLAEKFSARDKIYDSES